jgi:hypothetical protein
MAKQPKSKVPRKFYLPIKGLHKAIQIADQPELTTQHMMNVRAPGTLERQLRISQRPGLERWSTVQLGGGAANPIVRMVLVDVVDTPKEIEGGEPPE